MIDEIINGFARVLGRLIAVLVNNGTIKRVQAVWILESFKQDGGKK